MRHNPASGSARRGGAETGQVVRARLRDGVLAGERSEECLEVRLRIKRRTGAATAKMETQSRLGTRRRRIGNLRHSRGGPGGVTGPSS